MKNVSWKKAAKRKKYKSANNHEILHYIFFTIMSFVA